jgi:hypothetical protein
MFNLLSRFRSKAQPQAFNSSTAPSETVALEGGRSVIAYRFNGMRLLFDADFDWRFIGTLPGNATRAAIAQVAEAYFRGFEQAQGELREIGLSDDFLEMARQYALDQAGRTET